jgi:hypothetical protein
MSRNAEDLALVQERFLEGIKHMVSGTGLSKTDRNEYPASGSFAPVPLPQLLDEPEPLEPEWVLEDLLPAGALACLAAKPKVGKTTIAYEFAVAVAQGRPFLGRVTKQGGVLLLALEEHRRDVKRRLRDLGGEGLDTIHVHSGPLDDTPDTLHALAAYIKQHAIILVLFDTLNSFWSVTEENDAGAVTAAIKPVLQLARDTGAAVLLIHHVRKSEGEFGDEIRGSGALFSLLDVALILKRHEVEIQRKLTVISRYAEAPPELLLELREAGYVCLGDPAAVGKVARLTKLAEALTDTPMEVKGLSAKAGLPVRATHTLLDLLVQQGRAVRTGAGKRGNPFLFLAPPKSGTPHETNSGIRNAEKESRPRGGFVSCDPPILGVDKKQETPHVTADSFLATPVPPARNELETDEEFIIDGGANAT